jgi:hypothetical protein
MKTYVEAEVVLHALAFCTNGIKILATFSALLISWKEPG